MTSTPSATAWSMAARVSTLWHEPAVPGTDQHLTLQSRMIDLNRADFVGRLETFDRDFAEVCERIGAPAVPTTPRNQTAPGGRDRRVSGELAELVARMYARDYQVFGYPTPV